MRAKRASQDNGRRAAAFSRPLRRNLGATDPRLAASSDGTVLGIAAAKEREPTAIVPKMHVYACTLPCSAMSDFRPSEDAVGVSERGRASERSMRVYASIASIFVRAPSRNAVTVSQRHSASLCRGHAGYHQSDAVASAGGGGRGVGEAARASIHDLLAVRDEAPPVLATHAQPFVQPFLVRGHCVGHRARIGQLPPPPTSRARTSRG